jgi:glycosyltransferase involved in cell wall biosynthesis
MLIEEFNKDLSDRSPESKVGLLDIKDKIVPDHKYKDLLISIVIPLYNEEKSILNVINRIPNHFRQEIIVVDDGSTDKGINKLKKARKKNLKIIKHKINQGYGAALLTGFINSQGDIIVTFDSDGQHNPEEIHKLIVPIIDNRADMVIGSRYLGKCGYKIPYYTRLGECTINLFFRIFYGKSISNNQSGFRAIKRDILENIKNIKNKRMAFTTEFLFELLHNKKRIIEVPILMNPRSYGDSHVKVFKILRAIMSILFQFGLKKIIYSIKSRNNV